LSLTFERREHTIPRYFVKILNISPDEIKEKAIESNKKYDKLIMKYGLSGAWERILMSRKQAEKNVMKGLLRK